MKQNQRFSILPFPQRFDGAKLTFNVVVLPRNQNPLTPAIEGAADVPDASVAFADAALSFRAHIVSGLADFPNNHSAAVVRSLSPPVPADARALFEALATNFQISNLGATNTNMAVNGGAQTAPAPLIGLPVRKYLPLSYRAAFNFTTARTKAAVTDDSYLCAIRNAAPVSGFQKTPEAISWGKAFAYALRQPTLAEQLGMIYRNLSIDIGDTDFPNGGWLFVDLADDSDLQAQMVAGDASGEGPFLRKYAVRVPALVPGTPRQLFAPLLFPVLWKKDPGDPDPVPPAGDYAALFAEAADYDDGFAKIVHAMQPVSRDFLAEESTNGKPVKDAGIRLGWDDEQILIWYLRQLAEDSPGSKTRIDAPLGVLGYAIDVLDAADPGTGWQSLGAVKSKAALQLPAPDGAKGLGTFAGELPYQVYPSQLDGNLSGTWWLPIYFANWTGGSMVLPDLDAVAIYRHAEVDATKADNNVNPAAPASDPHKVLAPPPNQLGALYEADGLSVLLRYGHQYRFRVRLRDMSGGGPAQDASPEWESPSAVHTARFRRYVAPHQPRLDALPVNTDTPGDPDTIVVRRPLLGYPAAVYTGRYADPVDRLIAASKAMAGKEAFGIPDPDVDRIEIIVEIESLKLDKLASSSGRENYVALYKTVRAFPAVADDDGYAATLTIPLVYKDIKVVHTGDAFDLAGDFGLAGDIDDLAELVIPTARRVRLTLRAVCADREDAADYYGLINDADPDADSRFGQIVELWVYRASDDETDLFVDTSPVDRLRGIMLRPDSVPALDGRIESVLFGRKLEQSQDLTKRLAAQLGLEANGLTLVAPKGERVQFGCSSRIRHTLAPDNSSITFASEGDLINHWLCCTQLTIDRDWMWDALADLSFLFARTVHFTLDLEDIGAPQPAGDIEVRRTASFEMLDSPRRDYTRLVFIDAVEPKNERMQAAPAQDQPRFPDTIDVAYSVSTTFKAGHGSQHDDPERFTIHLPISTPPAQVPKIASAGIALSPYRRNDGYSETESRRRVLWIEFEEPITDPDDVYFARLLGYAPDQLISNNHPELLVAPDEPPLPIDPELTKVVITGASNDLAGLTAMQPMTKALDSDRHYLLPLPPGLNVSSNELFGFFSYEFRVGHYRRGEAMVWSTAQGRFGRRLKANGIQHPPPPLTCAVNRDEEKLWVVSPFATAVFEGRNVTADPPHTQLWCLLYAQVRQADDLDNRNILLDDKQLDARVEVNSEPALNPVQRYDDAQLKVLREVALKNTKLELGIAKVTNSLALVARDTMNKDARQYGTAVWSNDEIAQWLDAYGLPVDSSLSVLVVEVLPRITRFSEHLSSDELSKRPVAYDTVQIQALAAGRILVDRVDNPREAASPVSDELGQHRILRTSPLTKVPFVC